MYVRATNDCIRVAETLRKYPPVQCLSRVCTKSYTLPGTNIVLDEGTALSVPVFAIHHDEQFYEDPEKFDPGRFSRECINEKVSGTYLPFGDGPRVCIGEDDESSRITHVHSA